MASTDKPSTPPPPPASTASVSCFVGDVALRVMLFAASLVSVVVMVTSKQTELVPVPGAPVGVAVLRSAKFNHSPAFIYFIAALSVAGLYSIITTLASLSVILKPANSKKVLLFFAIFDALILGIVASATGAAGAVAYIGLKGNGHVGWSKVCNRYDKFCKHVGSSVAMSLLASIIIVLLIKLSVYSLYKRIRD